MNNPALMELAACPFCKRSNSTSDPHALEVYPCDGDYQVRCGHCVAFGPMSSSEEGAAEAWNQLRTAAAEGGEVVAEVVTNYKLNNGQNGTVIQANRELPFGTKLYLHPPTDSGAGRDGSLALEVAYTEARVWKVEAMAARKVCDEWNKSAIAEGYGLGNTRACELLQAMDAARKAHEEKEAEDTAIAGAAGDTTPP